MASSRREYFRRTRKVRMRDLNRSTAGWFGLVFDLIAAAFFVIAVIIAVRSTGETPFYVGSLGLFGLFLSGGGLILGIMGTREENVRLGVPRTAIVLGACMAALLAILFIFGRG